MIVSSSVDLPTPLRPSSARLPPSGTANVMPSSTPEAPEPPRTSSSASSASAMTRPAQIDLAHPRVGSDLLRCALDQDAPADHHDDALREAEHDVHVVLDEQDRDVAREIGD